MKALRVFLLLLAAASPLAGCVVGDEEYDEALRKRDEYRAQLRELYQANDELNQEIAGLYAECEALSARLALVAASGVQREYTADLLPARPAGARSRPSGT